MAAEMPPRTSTDAPARVSAAVLALYVAVPLAIAVLTWGLMHVIAHPNPADAALTYILLVLAASTLQDVWLGAFAAAVSVLALNFFFLPPVGTLTVADPANWFALVAFLVTSVVSSQLVTRARRRTRLAESRERLAHALLDLSDAFASSLAQTASAPPEALVADLARACGRSLEAVGCVLEVLHPWQARGQYGDAGRLDAEALAVGEVVRPGRVERFADIGAYEATWVAPLGGRGDVEGVLAVAVTEGQPGPDREAVEATARLATVALERAVLARQAAQAEAARQSELLKTALLSGVSHELRTPLAAIRLSATALQRPEIWRDEAARADLLDALDQEAARLNARVGSLLAMSRVESGSLVLELSDVDAAEIIAAAVRHLGPTAQAERLHVNVPDSLPPVRADVAIMGVALANLIDNALKYAVGQTPIDIEAWPTDDGAAVALTVADRGPGLAPEERERVFDRFYRGASSASTRAPGTGLGLSIARALVNAHQGRAWAQARPGGGTVFCLALPRADSATHPPPPAAASHPTRKAGPN